MEIFRACASGGADWRFIASGPWRMISMAVYTDPGLVLFAVLALFVLIFVVFSSKLVQNLPALFLMGTLAITVLIFGSPGTAGNHLLDVQVASVILLASWLGTAVPFQAARRLCSCTVDGHRGLPIVRHVKTWSPWYLRINFSASSKSSTPPISRSFRKTRSFLCLPGSRLMFLIPGWCSSWGSAPRLRRAASGTIAQPSFQRRGAHRRPRPEGRAVVV